MSIIHLYKCPEFFKQFEDQMICCMEKIHGTSTYINCSTEKKIVLHSGGEPGANFRKLFDLEHLEAVLMGLLEKNSWSNIRVHGECYGAKQQKMSTTYGLKLKFIVFDVKITNDGNERFLPLAEAVEITKQCCLEFVPFVIGPNTPKWIEEQTRLPSIQAEINGCGTDKLREGVVVRSIDETPMADGTRAIFKHKNAHFWETRVPGRLTINESETASPSLSEKLDQYTIVDDIANNWVTEMRGMHVADKILHTKPDNEKRLVLLDIKTFVNNMVADVKKESVGEIDWNDQLEAQIRRKSGAIFHQLLQSQ